MRKKKKYSEELKIAAVKSYLAGEGGLRIISKRYGISDHSILRDWILWYNGHREIKRSSAKGEIYMTNEERQRKKNAQRSWHSALNTTRIMG